MNRQATHSLRTVAAQGTVMALLAILFFVDLFLPWYQQCLTPAQPAGGAGVELCSTAINGWGGAGVAAGILALLLFLWEGLRVARVVVPMPYAYRSLISAVLGVGVLVFAVIEILINLGFLTSDPGALLYGGLFAWLGLALAALIGIMAAENWRIWQLTAPPPIETPTWGMDARPMTYGPSMAAPAPPATPEVARQQSCPGCGHLQAEPLAHFCSNCGRPLP